MITRRHDGRRHLGNGQADGYALGGADDDLLVDLDAILVAQNARQHDLGAVADRVDGRVLFYFKYIKIFFLLINKNLHYNALVLDQNDLERLDDLAQVALVLVMFYTSLINFGKFSKNN